MFNRTTAALLLLALMPWLSQAALPDPTKPAYPDQPAGPVAAPVPDIEPKLSAIWLLPKARWATINGIQAKEGQTITGNIEIIMIRRNTVTINQNGVTKTLELIKRPFNSR